MSSKKESILLSRSAKSPKFSNLMAEPTRQLLYVLCGVVEKKVQQEFYKLSEEEIPKPYASYDKQKYIFTDLKVELSEKGLSIETSYPAYFYMEFEIAITETDDSIQTRRTWYSIPSTFTLYISSKRNNGIELDIMDFDKKDMNEIAEFISKEAADAYKNTLEKKELNKKKSVNARSMADAIQFDFDNNRRKRRGKTVTIERNFDDDYAFLEIPTVGDLMIQDIGNELQFTLYKHGTEKELQSFTMHKSDFSKDRLTSRIAEPVLDKLLNK